MRHLRPRVAVPHHVALVAWAIAFVLFWGLPTLIIPFAGDQSWFALGARTVLSGDGLYSDFHDQKTPFIYLLYVIPQVIAGEAYEAVRVFDLLVTLAGMIGVFALARRFLSQPASALAAGLYGFTYLTMAGTDGLAETESFIVAPLTLAVASYPMFPGRSSPWLALFAGLMMGFAVGLKFSVAPFVLILPLLEWVFRDRQSWRPSESVKRLAFAAVGFWIVQAIWIGYVLANGILDDFIDIQVNFTTPYQNLRWTPDEWSFQRLVMIRSEQWLSSVWFLSLPAWIGLMHAFVSGRRSFGYILGALLGFAVLSIWWQGKFFAYHWLITLPFMAILSAYLLYALVEGIGQISRAQRVAVITTAAIGLPIVLAAPFISTWDGYTRLYDRFIDGRPQAEIDALYAPVLTQTHELIDYVRANSRRDEGLVIWGTWPQVLLQADRPSPTAFITSPPLRAEWTPRKWRVQYMSDLRNQLPRFFVVADGDWQPWLTGTDRSSREDFCDHFPELRILIERSYSPVFNNGLFIVYDREASVPRAEAACPDSGG